MARPRRRLQTLDDLRRYMQNTLNRLEGGEVTETFAKTVTYCVNVMAGIIKDGELESRLDALEKQMQREEKPWPA